MIPFGSHEVISKILNCCSLGCRVPVILEDDNNKSSNFCAIVQDVPMDMSVKLDVTFRGKPDRNLSTIDVAHAAREQTKNKVFTLTDSDGNQYQATWSLGKFGYSGIDDQNRTTCTASSKLSIQKKGGNTWNYHQ